MSFLVKVGAYGFPYRRFKPTILCDTCGIQIRKREWADANVYILLSRPKKPYEAFDVCHLGSCSQRKEAEMGPRFQESGYWMKLDDYFRGLMEVR